MKQHGHAFQGTFRCVVLDYMLLSHLRTTAGPLLIGTAWSFR